MVLVEASLRLKEEHTDAADRVEELMGEANAVLNFATGTTESEESSAGRVRFGSSSGSGRRKKHPGYVQEDESDSDDGEHQARIMRSRGPVTLTEAFALPLLRSCVAMAVASSQGGSADAGTGKGGRDTARRAKGWKGKGKQQASSRGGGVHKEEEEEEGVGDGVSDDQLLAVFRYWSKKRESFGGPMLRCFHPFMMKLWRRMEDPVREVSCVRYTSSVARICSTNAWL